MWNNWNSANNDFLLFLCSCLSEVNHPKTGLFCFAIRRLPTLPSKISAVSSRTNHPTISDTRTICNCLSIFQLICILHLERLVFLHILFVPLICVVFTMLDGVIIGSKAFDVLITYILECYEQYGKERK